MENSKIIKPKIIFAGTPEFGAIILDGLVNSIYKPILVITAPDKPVGRKQVIISPPVKLLAEKNKIPVLQPEKIGNCKLKIENCKPELIIVAAYNQIISKEILDIPKFGCLNVHPSLLPKYRGPSPIQAAILNGDKKTGVTIMLIDEKMDHGFVLTQRALKIEEKETGEILHNKLANLGARLLMETIPKWLRKMIKPKPQDEKQATYTKILNRKDGEINWKKPAEVLEKEVRAYSPWPGSFTVWGDKRLKILKSRVFKKINTLTYPIGKTLVAPQNELCVQTGKGFLIVEKLQLEGKKEMVPEEFLRGHPDFIGTVLR